MLEITDKLVKIYRKEIEDPKNTLVKCYEKLIRQYGTLEDARKLFDCFLHDNIDRENFCWEIIMAHGDASFGPEIMKACFTDGNLKKDINETVLHCLGYIDYQPAESVLMNYHLGESLKKDKHHSEYLLNLFSLYGLLHFSCQAYKEQLSQRIHALVKKNSPPLISGFETVLAYKTGDESLVEKIYDLKKNQSFGNEGIALSLALYGKAGEHFFKQLFWEEPFELIWSESNAMELGAKLLHWSIHDIFNDFKYKISKKLTRNDLVYKFFVLTSMLKFELNENFFPLKFVAKKHESAESIYHLVLLSPEYAKNNVLVSLAKNSEMKNPVAQKIPSFLEICNLYEHKIEQEIKEEYSLTGKAK